jgi:two-component system alkaline phosphatase synthesis response regulator PhoP
MTSDPEDKPRQRVFLVEDEPSLARTVSDMLRSHGYEVELSADGAEALNAAKERSYDIILLDVMLPSLDGFEIAAGLRRRGVDTPILMLTARDELSDKVAGLKAGADDYLTKPFEPEELLARMEALLRRASRGQSADLRSYDFGGLRVDFNRRRLIRDSETIELSDQECRLLRYLIERRGEVVTRDTLLKDVWGYDTIPITRTVDVHIAWLRQKIEADPKSPDFIVTVHGKGYRFDG